MWGRKQPWKGRSANTNITSKEQREVMNLPKYESIKLNISIRITHMELMSHLQNL